MPIQGPVLISGAPASEPISPTVASFQRGQVLFNVNCALCHGETGVGDGPLSQYFAPRPADLTGSVVRSVPDSTIFLVITQGFGSMPSLAENLLPVERWDVVELREEPGNEWGTTMTIRARTESPNVGASPGACPAAGGVWQPQSTACGPTPIPTLAPAEQVTLVPALQTFAGASGPNAAAGAGSL